MRGILGPGVPAHCVLCFVEADWPLLSGNFTTREVHALWPQRLYPKLEAEDPLADDTIAEIHRTLASGSRRVGLVAGGERRGACEVAGNR